MSTETTTETIETPDVTDESTPEQTTTEQQADKTPLPAEAATETETETSDEAEGDDGAEEWKEFLREELGLNVDKYANVEEARKGAKELIQLALRKNEDAEYGRQLRPIIGGKESEILALLQGQSKPTPAETPTKDAPDYDPAWRYQIVQDGSGNWVSAPGAPKDVVDKYKTYLEWRERQLDEFVRNPDKLVEKIIASKTQDIEQRSRAATEQTLAQQREQLAVEAWQDKNNKRLFVNGNMDAGLTPLGQSISRHYEELTSAGMPDRLKRLEYAERLAVAEHSSTSAKARKVPGKAVRQPAIAAHDDGDEKLTVEQMLDKYGFVKTVEIQNRRRAAAGALD